MMRELTFNMQRNSPPPDPIEPPLLMSLAPSPNVSHHLADQALTPLISSAQSPLNTSQSAAFSTITTTAVSAYNSASRLGLGLPLRIMVDTCPPGPAVLHSFLNPQPSSVAAQGSRGRVEQAREDMRPLSGGTTESDSAGASSGEAYGSSEHINGTIETQEAHADGNPGEEGSAVPVPPLLIGTVVAARAQDAGEARRIAGSMERLGREFQREWVSELQVERREPENAVED